MSGVTVAARLARREVVRRPWRSAVVLLIIVAPVMVLTAIAVISRTTDRTWEEQFAREAGTEDLRIDIDWIPAGGPVESDGELDFDLEFDAAELDLPEGSRVVEFSSIENRLRTVDGDRMWATITDRPLDDPISDGLIHRLEGRTPRTSDEVLLSPRVARALDVGVGDTLHLDRPADYEATVVGIAEWGRRLSTTTMAVGPDGGAVVVNALAGREADPTWLIDLPPSHEQNEAYIRPIVDRGGESRLIPPQWQVVGSNPQVTIVWTWIGGAVAFTILGVVIAAAFAVTARRQLRLIGQLMGNGAEERTLRATLFLQGTVIGAIGGALGIAITVAGLTVFQSTVEWILGQRVGAWEVRLADIIPILAIATVAATVAAVIPARSAVATSVLQALAGRRPVGPYPRRLVVRGAVAAAAGLGLLAVATAGATGIRSGESSSSTSLFVLTGIAGSIGVLLGACAMTPALIARLEPLAKSLRGTTRLAARSVARQRTRTGAVVAAIAVVAAGGVAGSTAWLTIEATNDAYRTTEPDDLVTINYEVQRVPEDRDAMWELVDGTPPSEIVDQVLDVIPGARAVPNRRAVTPSSTDNSGGPSYGGTSFVVIDDVSADAFDVHPDVLDAIDTGAVVQIGWGEPSHAPTTTVIFDDSGNEFASAPLVAFPPSKAGTNADRPMISEETARRLGLEIVDGPLVLQTPEPMTGDQRDQLTDLNEDLLFDHQKFAPQPGDEVTYVWLEHPYESFEPSDALITTGVVGVATILVLAVVALGLSLSAAETKDERDVLAAIGARPRTLRRLAAAKAAVLSSTGIIVGVPLGFIPVVVVLRAASMDNFEPYSPVFPWVQVGLLLVVVPLVATLATIAASGIALRVRPVTASSMAFD